MDSLDSRSPSAELDYCVVTWSSLPNSIFDCKNLVVFVADLSCDHMQHFTGLSEEFFCFLALTFVSKQKVVDHRTNDDTNCFLWVLGHLVHRFRRIFHVYLDLELVVLILKQVLALSHLILY